ncbi:MAG TPA: ABC transporter permease, partial [Gammaproteobacteria bacterium]|nr:ABC transporter permease [Gammaproteobacteria bacterium]
MNTIARTSGSPFPRAVVYGIAFLGIVLAWEALALAAFRGSSIFPGPLEVFHALAVEMSWDALLRDCAISLSRVAVGASVAIGLGIPLGLACSAFPRAAEFVTAVIEFFRPIPPIAWIPLAILWFGIGEMPSYFIIFLAAFFPVFTNSFSGGHSISRVHRDVARSLLLNRRQYLKHVLLPTALPQIMAGIQVGLGIAWMAVIASEMVASQEGLGYLIQLNRPLLMSDRVIAGMVLIGVIGFLMNRASVWVGHLLT